MFFLLAQTEGFGSIAVQGAVGIASLAIAGLFLKYIRERDAKDERSHSSCEKTIREVVKDHKECIDTLTGSFSAEMGKERDKRDIERKEFRETVDALRNIPPKP